MKTIEDLKALLPTLLELFSQEDHKIGESYWDQDEDGWGKCSDYESNYFCYEEDGWCIEIDYQCCGDWDSDSGDYWNPPYCELRRAWGEILSIEAMWEDEESGDSHIFNDNELAEFRFRLEECLEECMKELV